MSWSPRVRLWLACCSVSGWLFLLLIGYLLGGAVHLLLLLALALWPWRGLGGSG